MFSIFKMAFRNIWRNKRRTLITATSIMFAVFFAVAMQSLQKGAWDNMVSSVINYYFGYAQVHKKGYWEEQSINKAFAVNDEITNTKKSPIEEYIPRIESFALASSGPRTKGTLVIGVDPELENSLTDLKEKLIKGTYFEASDKAVVIAEGLADYLKVDLRDTLILVSQGYRGVNAVGKYAVKGMVKFPSGELNNQMLYLPLAAAQQFYGAEELVTTLVLKTDQPKAIKQTVANLRHELDTNKYEIMDWEEMIPDLVQARELDEFGSTIVLWILYLIIGFGIFGTLLMMVKERSYEFGVLTAIGMPRWKQSLIVWLEIIFIGIIGAIAGMILATPLVLYFKNNPIQLPQEMAEAYEKFGVEPIIPMAFDPKIFLLQAFVILGMVTLMALYPMIKISLLNPIKAMRE